MQYMQNEISMCFLFFKTCNIKLGAGWMEKMILEIEIPLSGGSIFWAKIADFFGFFGVEILTEEKEYTWEVGA